MTTSAQVAAVWNTAVWQHEDIAGITTKVLNHEYTDDSEFEIDQLSENGELNFFEYVVVRGERIVEIGGQSNPEYEFQVECRYTRQKDTEGEAHRAVVAAIETLCDTVRTELGASWGSLNVKTGLEVLPEQITSEQVNETACFRQVVRFNSFKF